MIRSGESIQVEKGEFARIHNDILNALAVARFSGSEYRCLMFLFRKTYGWGKKEDRISISQWAEGTGIDEDKRHNVWRTIQGLAKKGVIYVVDNGNNRPKTYGFVKYFERWDTSLFSQTVMRGDNKTVMPQDNYKRKKEKKDHHHHLNGNGKACDDDDDFLSEIETIFDEAEVRLTKRTRNELRNLKHEYGIVPTLEGVKTAADNDKLTVLRYIRKCVADKARASPNGTDLTQYDFTPPTGDET